MDLNNWSMAIFGLALVASFILGSVIILIWQRTKGGIARKTEDEDYKKQVQERKNEELKTAQSVKIRDFMEFDTVEDDMIVQNDGTRYVMAIKCMGINYDLMSEPEMLGVEEGFANFLNTLKFPIQLYVQARSLDLSEGIRLYHKRLDDIKDECDKYIDSVNRAKAMNASLTASQKQSMDFEIKKKRNLLDYGADIVNYIEKMSLNRNILQRKYFIIVSYETSEMGMTSNFTKDEARDVAYSELYTRCKTIQAAIASCGIETELLKSEELAELLYIAYNKDDADVYDVKKAINSGFYRLYSTAPSVIEKKREALDAKLKEEAIAQAEFALKNAIEGIRNSENVDITALTEEEQFEDDTKKEAMQIIIDNQEQFDPEVVDKALEDLNSSMHKPLVSQEELDAVSSENYDEDGNYIAEEQEPQSSAGVTAENVDNLINGTPIDDILN